MARLNASDRSFSASAIDRARDELRVPLDRLRLIASLSGVPLPSTPSSQYLSGAGIAASTGNANLLQVGSEIDSAIAYASKRPAGEVVELRGAPLSPLRKARANLDRVMQDLGTGLIQDSIVFPRIMGEGAVLAGVSVWEAHLIQQPDIPVNILNYILDLVHLPTMPADHGVASDRSLETVSRCRGRLEAVADSLQAAAVAIEPVDTDTEVPDDGNPPENCGEVVAALKALAEAVSIATAPPVYSISDVSPTFPMTRAPVILTVRWAKAGNLRRQKQISAPNPRQGIKMGDIPQFDSGSDCCVRFTFSNNQTLEISVSGDGGDFPDRFASLFSPPPVIYRTFPSPRPATPATWAPRGATIADRSREWEVITEVKH